MKKDILRVAVIGPESAGKTTLCDALAKYYRTLWVPEYSRDYISALNRPYTKEDILFTIREQCKLEETALIQTEHILFSDTDPIIASVWMQDVYHEKSEEIENLIADYPYDLYLLLSSDLPFVEDPVRENPLRRQYFFDWYQRELEERKLNYAIIKGQGEIRIHSAIKEVDKLLSSQRKT